MREFRIFREGEIIGVASTLWFYLDIAKKRPSRVPGNYEELYGTCSTMAMPFDLEKWQPAIPDHIDFCFPVTTRISDFDINGHVNNAIILQYIETAICRSLSGSMRIKAIRLSYINEIPYGTDQMETQVTLTENGCIFRVMNGEKSFVCGDADICFD